MASWAGLALDPPSGEDLARYEGYFRQLDTHGTGAINSTQAAPLLDKAGLGPSVLAQIWSFADQDQDNLLSLQEFTVAIHLAMHAFHTGYLPPLERGRPDEHWLSDSDVAKYDGYFRALEPRGATHVDRAQAKPLFDRAGLGADALTQARRRSQRPRCPAASGRARCPAAPLPARGLTRRAGPCPPVRPARPLPITGGQAPLPRPLPRCPASPLPRLSHRANAPRLTLGQRPARSAAVGAGRRRQGRPAQPARLGSGVGPG